MIKRLLESQIQRAKYPCVYLKIRVFLVYLLGAMSPIT